MYLKGVKRVKNTGIMSFSTPFMDRKTKSSVFYSQMNILIDWNKISKVIDRYYSKSNTIQGNKPYDGLLLFKMLLLGIWNNLSDERTEELVNDSLSSMRFCGLSLEDSVPDHSTLSRFRKELTDKGAMDSLLRVINKQLENRGLLLKTGVKVDASLTQSSYKPKGKKTYQIAQDRQEDALTDAQKDKQTQTIKKIESPGVDKEARWLKKRGELIYGYKNHIGVDENGMILGVHTTTANEHDSKGLSPLLEKIEEQHLSKGVWTDKGYQVPTNNELLNRRKIKNRIQHKAYRNRPLNKWQKLFNKLISKTRYVVERSFGSMKKWFGSGECRYKGMSKTHTQHVLEAICHNLKRSPGLVCQLAK